MWNLTPTNIFGAVVVVLVILAVVLYYMLLKPSSASTLAPATAPPAMAPLSPAMAPLSPAMAPLSPAEVPACSSMDKSNGWGCSAYDAGTECDYQTGSKTFTRFCLPAAEASQVQADITRLGMNYSSATSPPGEARYWVEDTDIYNACTYTTPYNPANYCK